MLDINFRWAVIAVYGLLQGGVMASDFTIHTCKTEDNPLVAFEVIGQFDWSEMDILLGELSMDADSVERWFADESKRGSPILPSFPGFSRLMYVYEGRVVYEGEELRRMLDECLAIRGQVSDERSIRILKLLISACEKAQLVHAGMRVHSYG